MLLDFSGSPQTRPLFLILSLNVVFYVRNEKGRFFDPQKYSVTCFPIP